jgi:hypothetical protein
MFGACDFVRQQKLALARSSLWPSCSGLGGIERVLLGTFSCYSWLVHACLNFMRACAGVCFLRSFGL